MSDVVETKYIQTAPVCEDKMPGPYSVGWEAGYTAGVQAEREQCIKDVCQACYLEYEPILDERTRHWYHRRKSGDDTLCWATPIRRRVEEGE